MKRIREVSLHVTASRYPAITAMYWKAGDPASPKILMASEVLQPYVLVVLVKKAVLTNKPL